MVFQFPTLNMVCWMTSILSASLKLSGMAPAKFSKEGGEVLRQSEGAEESRGRKRQHEDMECTGDYKSTFQQKQFSGNIADSCDCDEFGLPLAKKINQMNIEFESRPNISQNSYSRSQLSDEFLAKYPFPKG